MDNVVKTVFGVMLRIVLLLMGLVFFLSLLAAAMVLLALWSLRALWARLMGRPVQPWTFQVLRRAQWQRFYRGAQPGSAQGPVHETPQDADIIDVVPREIPSTPKPEDSQGR